MQSPDLRDEPGQLVEAIAAAQSVRDHPAASPQLPPNILRLGLVSVLTAMSSSMVYGLLPVFLVKVLETSTASVGLIEGIAEATSSFIKIFSGAISDRIGQRKPLLVIGYTLSAINKLIFPLADTASMVLAARVVDRIGKGVRDAPRDAFLTDVTPPRIRGRGFGLRIALYTIGFVLGPLTAIALMRISGDDFRLVFWAAVIPAFLAIVVLVVAIKERPRQRSDDRQWFAIRRRDLARLPPAFWRAMMIASLLALARFSPAFLVLKAHDIGVDAAFVPMVLVVMHVVYASAAYPFGILADHVDRRLQLAFGAIVLVGADLVLATAASLWMTALGIALWGLQMGVTQGLLAATVAEAAPDHLRGTSFGLYEIAVGAAALAASGGAGMLWMAGGAAAAYGASAAVAGTAMLLLALRRFPPGTSRAMGTASSKPR